MLLISGFSLWLKEESIEVADITLNHLNQYLQYQWPCQATNRKGENAHLSNAWIFCSRKARFSALRCLTNRRLRSNCVCSPMKAIYDMLADWHRRQLQHIRSLSEVFCSIVSPQRKLSFRVCHLKMLWNLFNNRHRDCIPKEQSICSLH